MPPKPAETLNDPTAPPAFRSFWQAKAGPGRSPDMYEYQGPPSSDTHSHPHGHAHSHGNGGGGHGGGGHGGGGHDGSGHGSGAYGGGSDHGHSHGGVGGDSSHDHGHSHSHGGSGSTSESTPLLQTSTSSSSSTHRSSDSRIFGLFRSYASLCYCVVPVILLLLLLGWWLYHSPPPPPPAAGVTSPGSASIAALCNPFAVIPITVDLIHHHGLVALLFVLPPSLTSSAHSSTFYLQHSSLSSNATLFFSSVDTPTRLFSRVFEARNFTSGEEIYLPSQFFLLSFHTKLWPPSPPFNRSAEYDLALISDDGASLYVGDIAESSKQPPPKSRLLIDNDGVHTTRMAQSSVPLNLKSPVNLTLHYFQGPPAHIALQLLYRERKVGQGGAGDEGDEGEGDSGDDDSDDEGEVEEGNDLYWTVGPEGEVSRPTARYEELKGEGWEVIPESWYWLPDRYEGKADIDRQIAAGIDPCIAA